jgi:four helix bundle protein
MKIKKYDDLIVWRKAMELIRDIYQATGLFPKEECYGLTVQMRRAAVSVASNIAEGQGRQSTNEFLHHLSFAYGSLIELETQIRVSKMLGFAKPAAVAPLLARTSEIGRLLNGLRRALKCKLQARSTDADR